MALKQLKWDQTWIFPWTHVLSMFFMSSLFDVSTKQQLSLKYFFQCCKIRSNVLWICETHKWDFSCFGGTQGVESLSGFEIWWFLFLYLNRTHQLTGKVTVRQNLSNVCMASLSQMINRWVKLTRLSWSFQHMKLSQRSSTCLPWEPEVF